MQKTCSLLLAAALSAALPAAAEPLHYNIVEFSESASIEVLRDTMTARLRVHEEGRSREAVNAAFIKKFNSLNRKAAAGPFKTELVYRRASPRYEYSDKGRQTQTGWQEEALIQVQGKNFEAINKLIAQAQQEASLDGISFGISKQNREDAVDEVSKAALTRFKERAASLTKTMGARGYKIVRLDLGQIGNRSVGDAAVPMMRAAKAESAAAYAAVPEHTSPGTEEISITVRGTIQM